MPAVAIDLFNFNPKANLNNSWGTFSDGLLIGKIRTNGNNIKTDISDKHNKKFNIDGLHPRGEVELDTSPARLGRFSELCELATFCPRA